MMISKLGKIDYIILGIVSILICISIIIVFSVQQDQILNSSRFSNIFTRHIINIFIGGLALLFGIFLPLKKIENTFLLFVLSIGIAVILFLVIISGKVVNGASRWFSIGIISFQPSEIAKIILIFYTSHYICRKNGKSKQGAKWSWGLLVIIGGIIALIAIEPDISTALVLLALVLVYFFIGNVPVKFSFVLISSVILIGFMLYLIPVSRFKHLGSRVDSFIVHISNKNEINDQPQVLNSMLAFANGGIIGRGLGMGELKNGYFIPEIDRDMILAAIAEEMGMIGVLVIIAFYLLILIFGFRIASNIWKFDRFQYFLAVGISVNIFLYAIIHAFISIGLLPTTGLPLPFISYGGSSMVTNLFLLGVLLNISYRAKELEYNDKIRKYREMVLLTNKRVAN